VTSTLQWCLAAVFCTAAFFTADALWIPAKAVLAQRLIERAWQRSLDGSPQARPWPWADTHPVAILEVPRLGVRQFVLAGASGRNLAFGPTAVTPVGGRDVILSGHRDTHFRFLQELTSGDVLRLILPGRTAEFRVRFLEVLDSAKLELVLDDSASRLTLLTCFPFDALSAGGSQRYVVTAVPERGG
jgi:sortase A